ncbi:hypothetical protein LTR56_023372 [Elasticomyces elasticus]|nr:hypothetical protein LTR56_023372 [Elasticomyces elasticus]KAK3623925.1 hypothetical protein LTR22_024175 [Elasticomyces elasticus]KAK4906247.1 hypothetical protein LTR49_024580 [Elasticomyces elasticus]
MPGSYDEMDAPQDRQRDVANIPGDEEASTLTKRTCLNILDAESSGNRELAKITELTRTDFPAVVESDGADCSRFRYCGALAFTSENNNTYSDSSISPGRDRTFHDMSLPSRVSAGDVRLLSNVRSRDIPMPKPKMVLPVATEPGTPLAEVTSHGLKRKRSASRQRMPEGRLLAKSRLTTENSDHRGNDSNLLGLVRSNAQSLADELEREGRDIWTGTRPTIMLTARFCKPRDLHILATDGRLTDEFLNTIPVLGDCKDTDGYLLQTFVVRLIKEARFRDLDRWTMAVPKQSKPWLFGLHESDHWMAVRIDWTGRLVQHYDPMHQKLTRRIRRTLQGCIVVGSA